MARIRICITCISPPFAFQHWMATVVALGGCGEAGEPLPCGSWLAGRRAGGWWWEFWHYLLPGWRKTGNGSVQVPINCCRDFPEESLILRVGPYSISKDRPSWLLWFLFWTSMPKLQQRMRRPLCDESECSTGNTWGDQGWGHRSFKGGRACKTAALWCVGFSGETRLHELLFAMRWKNALWPCRSLGSGGTWMGLRRVWASVQMGSEELLLRLHLSNSWRFLLYICIYVYNILYSCSSSTVLIDHTCILSVLLRRQLFCNQKNRYHAGQSVRIEDTRQQPWWIFDQGGLVFDPRISFVMAGCPRRRPKSCEVTGLERMDG